jgi:hypothetical protein
MSHTRIAVCAGLLGLVAASAAAAEVADKVPSPPTLWAEGILARQRALASGAQLSTRDRRRDPRRTNEGRSNMGEIKRQPQLPSRIASSPFGAQIVLGFA